jgi:hypothetical protein
LNTFTKTIDGIDPFANRVDAILAEIAFSVQLPPSLHGKAVDRYEAVRKHLEATTSIFAGQIEHFYPQGSMAIDATISNRGTDDEYDLDIVAQVGDEFRYKSPNYILTELEKTLIGYRGLQVVRQTRCVTIYYADNMHLDITPSLRDGDTPERQSVIMHARGPNVSVEDHKVPMNAYGFVEWYKEKTPIERRVIEAFSSRWKIAQDRALAAAEVDEVPVQTQFVVKNTATLALQLLKRYRNIRYANRKGRMPPSVMLSYYCAMAASSGVSLTEMLLRVSKGIIAEIENASLYRRLLHVANPVYTNDVFTDRWPENIDQQDRFASDLKDLVHGLELALSGELPATRLQNWLREMFGYRVVTMAVDRMAREMQEATKVGSQGYTRRGGILVPAGAGLAPVAAAYPSPVRASPHTFFGDHTV